MTRPLQASPRTRPPVVEQSGLLVCAPLRLEARAVRRGLDGTAAAVVATGYGPRRAAARAATLGPLPFGALAVAGTGGGLADDLVPGDLVVASEVSDGQTVTPIPSAQLLAGELRRAGLRVRTGRVVTVDHLFRPGQRDRLAASGAIAVDMESAELVKAARGRPVAVVRAISDTPGRPLLRPAALGGGLAALRSLSAAGPALSRWAAAVGERQVLLAGPRSFCAGVERAIEIVEKILAQHGPPVYVRKQIVHNSHVVSGLEARGAIFVDELSEVPDGARVVFSAHGVSPVVRSEADRRGLTAVDATCPLVAKVHAEARRFAADGYLVALIGHAGHEEVEGTLGEAPDSVALVQTAEDVGKLQPEGPGQGGLSDADHAGHGRGGGHRRRAARAVPGRPRAGQRRHLLRHHQPAARGPRRGGRVRPGAGGRVGQLLQLCAAGGNRAAGRYPCPPDRRPVRHRAGLAGRGVHDRPDRGCVRAARPSSRTSSPRSAASARSRSASA